MGEGVLGRRGVVAGLAGGACLLLPAPAMAGIPASRRLAFEVLRNARPIGSHVLSFGPPGPVLEVRIAVEIVVRWAGLVLYRYGLAASETWRDGVLVAARGSTNDDGSKLEMTATRRDGRLRVEGTHGPAYDAPARSIIATHWNPAQLAAPMVDVQDGRLLDFTIDPRGRTTITAQGSAVEADHYKLSGPAALELWYDGQGVWSKLAAQSWEGSTIDYRRT